MNGAKQRSSVVVDSYTRCCLTAIAVLLAVLAVGLWAEAPVVPTASAAGSSTDAVGGFGNPNAQRQAIIRELSETNRKLSEIADLLKSGKIKVVLGKAENTDASAKPNSRLRK